MPLVALECFFHKEASIMSNRKRRGRGEASIFERADGQWVGSVSLGYHESGKRKRKTVYGSTKAEVQEKIDQLRTDVKAGVLPCAGTMTVGKLFDRWLETSKCGISPLTFDIRTNLVNTHIKPRIGGLKLNKLNSLHVEALYADVESETKSAWTARSVADAVSYVLKDAKLKKLIGENPAANVRKPRLPTREMLVLDPDRVNRLLMAAKTSNINALISLALATGCRQGELLGLAWNDIELRTGRLTIRHSLAQAKAGFVLKCPKSKAGRRTIELPSSILPTIEQHRASAAKAGLLDAPVFCTRKGDLSLQEERASGVSGRSCESKQVRDRKRPADHPGTGPLPRPAAHGRKHSTVEGSFVACSRAAARACQSCDDTPCLCACSAP